jgi:hypothetical protein
MLFGSILPDIPLFILTVGFIIAHQLNPNPADPSLFGSAYDTLYFTNPWWIAGHNLFHGPLLILLYGGIGYGLMRQTVRPSWQKWGGPLLWLAVGCGLHTLIDIFTHVTDGPVLFFPLNWHYRFFAPVSYWDPQYGGRTFAIFEHLLDALLVGWLIWQWMKRRRGDKLRGSGS